MKHRSPTVKKKNEDNIITTLWNNLELSICLIGMVSMVIITFVQVVSRYGFNYSFSWSEEICRFLLVWVTFGGSAYAFRVGAHIGVTAVVDLLAPKFRMFVLRLSRIITILFFVVLTYYGWLFTAQQIAIGHTAAATGLSMAVAYSAVPIGSSLVIIRLVYDSIINLKQSHNQEVL